MPKSPSPKTEIKLGPITAQSGDRTPSRIALLLWGAATCGKTTLSATAPGHKLWLSFGDNEHTTIAHRKDVTIADFSGLTPDELIKHAKSDNPFGLDGVLSEHTHIESVIVDSSTALEYSALSKAVQDKIGGGPRFTPTMEAPGIAAYGGRNAILLAILTGLLRVTAKHNVHVIVTAHEADPVMVKGQDDVIDYISIMLGGKSVNNVTWRFSEIWFMWHEATGERARKIAIRSYRNRRPMKSRMFTQKSDPFFELDYDPDLPDEGQMTIASFYEEWMDGGKVRIPLPRPKAKTPVKKR